MGKRSTSTAGPVFEELEPRLLLSTDLSLAGIAGPVLQQDDQPVIFVDLEVGSQSASLVEPSVCDVAQHVVQPVPEEESENGIISIGNNDSGVILDDLAVCEDVPSPDEESRVVGQLEVCIPVNEAGLPSKTAEVDTNSLCGSSQTDTPGCPEARTIQIRGPPEGESGVFNTDNEVSVGSAEESTSSAIPVLPGLELVGTDTSRWAGQIIYLDFDGTEDVIYNGPVTVGPFDVPTFRAPAELAGQEDIIISSVVSELEQTFSGNGIIFTTSQPSQGTEYSTIFVGGDDSYFAEYGSFLGLAEQVDVSNRDRRDDGLVFSENLAGRSVQEYAEDLADIIAHEAGHLVGFSHTGPSTDREGQLSNVSLPIEIYLGTPVNGTLEGTGDSDTFSIEMEAGQHLAVQLDGDNPSDQNELYIRYGALPTLTEYDAAGKMPYRADQYAEIPNTQQGTYYIMVRCAWDASSPDSYTLQARLPGIDSVGIERGIDYEVPGIVADDGYEYQVEVRGAGITGIEVMTPWEHYVDLQDLLPPAWDGQQPVDTERGPLDFELDIDDQGLPLFAFRWDNLTQAQWTSLNTGQTAIVVMWDSGSWSASLDFDSVPQSIQEPCPTSPINRSMEPDNVTIQWGPWDSPPPNSYIDVEMENAWGGGGFYEKLPALDTSWTPSMPLGAGGFYECNLAFNVYAELTVGGVPVTIESFAENDFAFVVGIPDASLMVHPDTGHVYFLTAPGPWWQAQAVAAGFGGNLVTINDDAEETWLEGQYAYDELFWIGFTDSRQEGTWEWISGEPVTYTNWAPWGEPNGAENENAAVLYDYWWHDAPMDWWERGIVELPPGTIPELADDHGNTSNDATVVTVPTSLDGQLSYIGDIDFFSFDAIAGKTYDIRVDLPESGLEDSTVWLYGTDGQTLLAWNDDGGHGLGSRLVWVAPVSGSYFLALDSYELFDVGGYTLQIVESDLIADTPLTWFDHPAMWLDLQGNWGVATSKPYYTGATSDDDEMLHLLNMSDPSFLVELGQYLPGDAEGRTILASPRRYYLSDDGPRDSFGHSELVVLDMDVSGDPVEIYRIPIACSDADSMAIGGNYLYLGTQIEEIDDHAYLEVYDISNPDAPIFIGLEEIAGPSGSTFDPDQLLVAEGRVYMLHSDAGMLSILDVQNPAAPQLLGQYTLSEDPSAEAEYIAIAGSTLWVGVGWELHAIDVSDAANPARLSVLPLDARIHQIVIDGSWAYVGTAAIGVKVVDIFDPSDSVVVDSYTVPGTVGTLAINNGYIYIPTGARRIAIFEVPPAPALPDLLVTHISTPVAIGSGEVLSVGWIVQNRSATATTTAFWTDAVFLSTDSVPSPDELVGTVEHTEGLAGRGIYTASLGLDTTGIAEGTYYVIVVTDYGHVVAEQREGNNTTVSQSLLCLGIPVLTLGVPTEGTFQATRQSLYYVVSVTDGEHLHVVLDDANDIGHNELYAKFGSAPTRSDYDARYSANLAPDQQVQIPNTQSGNYYILIYAESAPDAPADFTLTASILDFQILGISPVRAGNAGEATLTIRGANFPQDASVTLISPTDAEISPIKYYGRQSDFIYATFDLTGVESGVYDVRVAGPIVSTSIPDIFHVTLGAGPNVTTDLVVPSAVRPGRKGTLWLNYANTGDADAPAPLLIVSTDLGGLRLEGEGQYRESVQVLGINSSGPAGILPPGFSGSIPIYLMSEDAGTANVSLDAAADDTPIDWPSLKESMRPSFISDAAWDVIWNNFASQVGTTWGDYQAMLDENATYLSLIGEHDFDIGGLLALEFREADGLNPLSILAAATDASVTAPGLLVVFSRFYSEPISRRLEMGPLGMGWAHSWQFSLEDRPDGTIAITDPSGTPRLFTPDGTGHYIAQPGDNGTLTVTGGGAFHLREVDGTLYAFRAEGKLDYVEDTNGNRISCGYTSGRLMSLTHSSGQSLTIAYNAAGLIASVTDSEGRQTLYTYDASNVHLLSVQDYDGRVTSYAYSTGQGAAREHALIQITYPGVTHQYFGYDTKGRLSTTYRDGGAERVTFTYGSDGKVTATDALGNSSHFYFDDWGRITKTEDALGNAVSLTFDDEGNLTRVTDPSGRSYHYVYDNSGNLISSIDALGNATRFTYTGMYNRLASVIDADGNVTRYVYDSDGNLVSITYADGSRETWTYDALGNPTAWTNRRGTATASDLNDHVIIYTYDSDGRITRKTYADGSYAAYTYDSRGNLIQTVDSYGTTTFTYDTNDYLTRIDYPQGQWLQFSYDDAGRRSSSLDQIGHQLNYKYDAVSRLESMTDETGTQVVLYTYDAAGRMQRKTLGNGVYTTYEYDAAGQLLHLVNYNADGSVLSRFDYTYDSRGRRTSMGTSYGTWTYEYDDLGQLTHAVLDSTDAAIPDQDLTYVYDALGNRIRTIENGVTTEYTVNNMNQYIQVGDTTYVFDADGNLIQETGSDGTTTYMYNDENRLVAVTKGADTWQYTYDALGNRVATTENGVTSHYVIDPIGLGNLVGEYDASSNLIAHYDHGFGLLTQTNAGDVSYWYTFDAIGNVYQLVGVGVVANSYAYTPFGTLLAQTETIPNPFQFVGQFGVMKEANDLNFMRARYYSLNMTRFTQGDTIGIAGGINAYKYSANNPVSFVDASGECYNIPSWSQIGADTLLDAMAGGYPDKRFGELWKAGRLGSASGSFFNEWTSARSGWERMHAVGKYGLKATLHTLHARGVKFGGRLVDAWDRLTYDLFYWWFTRGHGTPARSAQQPFCGWSSPQPPPPEPPPQDGPPPQPVPIVRPVDPNDKVGPAGFGEAKYILQDITMPFTIYYENDPELGATAPAQVVLIEDQLDADLNWTTFELGDINLYGDFWIDVPVGLNYYETLVDLRPEGNDLLVRVTAGLDSDTGMVTWLFESLDPDTMAPPDDPLAGFLPVNDKTLHNGEGHLMYTIRPLAGLASGTQITNQAFNTFDTNEPIATPMTLHTIDAGKPTSQVDPLPTQVTTADFVVSWTGQDDEGGSSIASYDIYVSDNGGPFALWLDDTTETSATFTGEASHTYSFYSVARDNVGHTEDPPAVPDAVTTVQLESVSPTLLTWTLVEDTGISSTDRLTNDTTPVLTFTFSEPVFGNAADVVVLDPASDAVTPDSITGWGSDTLVVTFASPLAVEGEYAVTLKGTATITDSAGNPLNGGVDEMVYFVLDTTAPAIPVVTEVADDTGTSGDGITYDNTLIINGTAEANSSLEVFLDGSPIGTTTANNSGNWSFDYTGTSIVDGTCALTATAMDTAGNMSDLSAVFTVVVDTVAPAAPVVTGIADDTGIPGDGITRDNTLTINGTAEANSTVTVYKDSSSIGATAADGSGVWAFDYSGTVLADGTYSFTASSTDAADNTSSASTPFAVVLDTVAPTVTVNPLTTSDPSPELTGTINDSSAAVQVTVDGRTYAATNNANGSWTLADNTISPALSGGIYDVAVMATDVAGNIGTDPTTAELTIVIPTPVDHLVKVSLGSMHYNRWTQQTRVKIRVKNISNTAILSPVWIVITSISDPSVTLVGSSGVTADGYPYIDVTGLLGDGRLDPRKTIATWLYFSNPLKRKFTITYSIRGVI